MKKRLRKKLHVKEFTEYGIEFEMKVTSPLKGEVFDKIMEDFVEDFVEGNNLFCGGGWDPKEKMSGFVIEVGRNIEKAKSYLPKLRKWFDDKDITFELTSSICNLWYPDKKTS